MANITVHTPEEVRKAAKDNGFPLRLVRTADNHRLGAENQDALEAMIIYAFKEGPTAMQVLAA